MVEGTDNVRRFNGWMQVEWAGEPGYIQINGTVYKLQQGHWHSPSEHTINGKKSVCQALSLSPLSLCFSYIKC